MAAGDDKATIRRTLNNVARLQIESYKENTAALSQFSKYCLCKPKASWKNVTWMDGLKLKII